MSQQANPPQPTDPLTELTEQLAPWVARVIGDREPRRVKSPKLIRDAVHGYHLVEPHEVAVLDCPFVQRLRYIHQTAFAYLIYPTAHHTRFDHSLGMAAIADRMMKALNETRDPAELTPSVMRTVRLAALLHDVGHTLFSHLTESIVEEQFKETFTAIKRMTFREVPRYFGDAAAGEIISYVIITCQPGREYIQQALNVNGIADVDIDKVAGLIVSKAPDDSLRFMADIINGPMDADKLDYLMRDCHFSGIRAEVDPERIYYTLDLIREKDWPRYLTVHSGGVPHLEQMILAKMMLYTSIYYHHKIRALECIARAMFETLEQHGADQEQLRFNRIVDYLDITEYEWLTLGSQEDSIRDMVRELLDRRLLKRCLVISRHTVKELSRPGLSQLQKLPEKGRTELKRIRQAILDEIPDKHRHGIEHLWLDVPGPANVDRAADHWVMAGDKPEPLSKSFPTPGWLRGYLANKLRAHVFYVDDDDDRRLAAGAAEQVLRDEFGLVLEPLARIQAKID